MEPLVSIIVPIYNAEKALNRCIDSILAQDYRNFELILMDDGSKDRSPQICDEYAAKDPRIRVIHKPNSGVSATRNAALDIARGEYIQFLDSDDWITPDATKLFVRSAAQSGCDLVIADFYRVVGESLSHKGDIEKEGLLTREEYANFMMENPADFYYGVLWNKLFRRDIIETHHLRMDPEISWCEDFLFNLEYLRRSRTVYALQAPVYYYVKTKGSLVDQGWSFSNTIKMKLNVFDYYRQFYKEVYEDEDYESIRPQIYRFLLASARDNFIPPAPLPGSKKLGQERTSILYAGISADGVPGELYRSRKLLQHYCETIARKNGMSVEEIYVLLCLSHTQPLEDLKELADFTGLSRTALTYAVQKLDRRGFLQKEPASAEDKKAARPYILLPAADPVLKDIREAMEDFDSMRFRGFSAEERETFSALSARADENIEQRLREISPDV